MPALCTRMRCGARVPLCMPAARRVGADDTLHPLLLRCEAVQGMLTCFGALQKQAQLSPVQKQLILELRSGFMDQLQALVTERR